MIHSAAVIGCGRMGAFPSELMRNFAPVHFKPFAHAAAITLQPDLELRAMCDPHDESLEKAGALYGCTQLFRTHQQMLQSCVPDLACIATRTKGRADLIADLLHAGVKALHIEKPLCNSMKELRELSSVFAEADFFATLGTVRRHIPIFRDAVRMANDGSLGRLREIRVSMGGEALYWTHPHSVDLILFAAGEREPQTVQAFLGETELSSDSKGIANDPAVHSASIRFDGGLIAHIDRAPGFEFRLKCDDGIVSVLRDGGRFAVARRVSTDPYLQDEVMEDASWRKPSGVLGPIEHLANCLSGDTAAVIANQKNRSDIVLGQRLLFAIGYSHLRGGTPVKPTDVPLDFHIEGRTGELFA